MVYNTQNTVRWTKSKNPLTQMNSVHNPNPISLIYFNIIQSSMPGSSNFHSNFLLQFCIQYSSLLRVTCTTHLVLYDVGILIFRGFFLVDCNVMSLVISWLLSLWERHAMRPKIWRKVKIMNHVVHFSPPSSGFIYLRSKYSPQHPVP
jgi:hypothetical protein